MQKSSGNFTVDYLATKKVTKSLYDYFSINSERELLDKLGCDYYYLSCRDLSQNECSTTFYKGDRIKISGDKRTCPLGITWRRGAFDDKFGADEAISGLLDSPEITEKDIVEMKLPTPGDYDFSGLLKECEAFDDKIIIGGLWSAIHGDSYRLMGYENFLLNIAMNRDLVKTLVNRMTDFYLKMNEHYFETLKGKMDIFFMGNDFGSQNGLLISLEDWHYLYYENYKLLVEQAHRYGFKVMIHSCGSIAPLLPYFIELGVDIVDPVQITAQDMDPEVLVEKYGKDLCFHGAIDTQSVLPHQGVEEVRDHVIRLVNTLNRYGSFIAAPSNNIMQGTPPENIEAVYDTLKELRDIRHL